MTTTNVMLSAVADVQRYPMLVIRPPSIRTRLRAWLDGVVRR